MTSLARRSVWPWVAIGALAVTVLVFLGSFLLRILNPPVSPLADESDPRSVIQVEVVNASGVKGAGRKTMIFLRERGFDVVEITSIEERPHSTMILDRVGDRVSAMKIAQAIGVADSLIRSEIDSMRFLRASIILGTDVTNLVPFAE